MKYSTAFALSALAALAVAIPLEKRDLYTTTVVDEVTETVDVVQTVWVHPGDPRLQQQQAAKHQPAAAPAHTTSQVIAPAPAYTPPPTSSPVPALQSVVVPPQVQQKNVVKPAAGPTSSPAPAPAVVSSPSNTPVAAPAIASAAAPVQSQSPASSPASSGSTSGSGPTGGSCGDVGGKCSGDATQFDGSQGLGSCGWVDPTGPGGPDYFALAYEMMGPASSFGTNEPANGNCGRKATIVYNGKEFPAWLADKCPGCSGQSIDLSPSLFQKVFGVAPTRFHDVEWYFTSPMNQYKALA